MKRFLIFLLSLIPVMAFGQASKTTLSVYAFKQTVTSNDYEEFNATGKYYVVYLDGPVSTRLGATLITASDTVRGKPFFVGPLEFGEVQPGKAKLIIENGPEVPDKYEPYSVEFTILPGDNIVFAELKVQGDDDDPVLPSYHVTSDDIKNHPMPVTLEQDGLHYAVRTFLFNILKYKENETYNRLKSFPGVTIKPKELILSGNETKYVKYDNALILNHSR